VGKKTNCSTHRPKTEKTEKSKVLTPIEAEKKPVS
jgi:hypothetical protein